MHLWPLASGLSINSTRNYSILGGHLKTRKSQGILPIFEHEGNSPYARVIGIIDRRLCCSDVRVPVCRELHSRNAWIYLWNFLKTRLIFSVCPSDSKWNVVDIFRMSTQYAYALGQWHYRKVYELICKASLYHNSIWDDTPCAIVEHWPRCIKNFL